MKILKWGGVVLSTVVFFVLLVSLKVVIGKNFGYTFGNIFVYIPTVIFAALIRIPFGLTKSKTQNSHVQHSNIAPLSYQQGDNVQLADGRPVVYFLSHAQDGTGMSQVVVFDDETGEQETIEIPRGQIMGLASREKHY